MNICFVLKQEHLVEVIIVGGHNSLSGASYPCKEGHAASTTAISSECIVIAYPSHKKPHCYSPACYIWLCTHVCIPLHVKLSCSVHYTFQMPQECKYVYIIITSNGEKKGRGQSLLMQFSCLKSMWSPMMYVHTHCIVYTSHDHYKKKHVIIAQHITFAVIQNRAVQITSYNKLTHKHTYNNLYVPLHSLATSLRNPLSRWGERVCSTSVSPSSTASFLLRGRLLRWTSTFFMCAVASGARSRSWRNLKKRCVEVIP